MSKKLFFYIYIPIIISFGFIVTPISSFTARRRSIVTSFGMMAVKFCLSLVSAVIWQFCEPIFLLLADFSHLVLKEF
nr:hypothetical protein [uncultured Campylobacter sp.]